MERERMCHINCKFAIRAVFPKWVIHYISRTGSLHKEFTMFCLKKKKSA